MNSPMEFADLGSSNNRNRSANSNIESSSLHLSIRNRKCRCILSLIIVIIVIVIIAIIVPTVLLKEKVNKDTSTMVITSMTKMVTTEMVTTKMVTTKVETMRVTSTKRKDVNNTSNNLKWTPFGITLNKEYEKGDEFKTIDKPQGIDIDDDETIYIVDTWNSCIVQWKKNAKKGQVIVGANGKGNRSNQLNRPKTVIIDQQTDSLIICDQGNKRVVRWPRQNGTNGEIIISNIICSDLAIDNNNYLYVSDIAKDEVTRWKIGDQNGTLVAGGNGRGNKKNQLHTPYYIFVDKNQSVYVSDHENRRIMKWIKDAKEGIIIAGGNGQGYQLKQLDGPNEIIVDQFGTLYIADCWNHRIISWLKGAKEGNTVVGGELQGEDPDQFNCPEDILFDQQNNLYVGDYWNQRVQKFSTQIN